MTKHALNREKKKKEIADQSPGKTKNNSKGSKRNVIREN